MNRMKKIVLLNFVSIIVVFNIYFIFFHKHKYHCIVPIEIDYAYCPVMNIEIENKHYPILIDLGMVGTFTLNKNIINELKRKKNVGNFEWMDLKGNKYIAPLYLIPKIDFGIELKKIEVEEESDGYKVNTTLLNEEGDDEKLHEVGSVGRSLLQKFNLLMDISKSRFIFSNNYYKLKKEGYDIDKYLKIPILKDLEGIIFTINTDLGKKKFFLDTGTSITLIRSSYIDDNLKHVEEHGMEVFSTNTFEIEGIDFGKQNLFLLDISSELNYFDGVLGMDFLKKHVCYIDFENGYLYIKKP